MTQKLVSARTVGRLSSVDAVMVLRAVLSIGSSFLTMKMVLVAECYSHSTCVEGMVVPKSLRRPATSLTSADPYRPSSAWAWPIETVTLSHSRAVDRWPRVNLVGG